MYLSRHTPAGQVFCSRKSPSIRYQAKTYNNFGVQVLPWARHLKASRDLLRRAFEAANQMGDLTFAAFACTNLATNLLAAGDPLVEVQVEIERNLVFAQKMRFGYAIDLASQHTAWLGADTSWVDGEIRII